MNFWDILPWLLPMEGLKFQRTDFSCFSFCEIFVQCKVFCVKGAYSALNEKYEKDTEGAILSILSVAGVFMLGKRKISTSCLKLFSIHGKRCTKLYYPVFSIIVLRIEKRAKIGAFVAFL